MLRVCQHYRFSHLLVLFYAKNIKAMSINITNLGGVVNYHDNHKEVTIHSTGNVSDIVRKFMADDVETVEEIKPDSSFFKFFTQKCFEQKRAEAVEAEIRAACKGTAEALWRTLWDNENLGYVEVEHIDATTLYREIENHYGKLPYSERNFRKARNNR